MQTKDKDFAPATLGDDEIFAGGRKYVAADRIEALQAERCVEVKPLEWLGGGDRYHANGAQCFVMWSDDACRWIADCWFTSSIGGWDTAEEGMKAVEQEYGKYVSSNITTRPASEVQAEAHAAAIEAAAKGLLQIVEDTEDSDMLRLALLEALALIEKDKDDD